jgi:hypothetical protein
VLIIIDKAAWQVDGGVPEDLVVNHFQTVFSWLGQHKMLSSEGEEELEDGIDSSASLNEDLVTSEGLAFLEKCYDTFLRSVESIGIYGSEPEADELEKTYLSYTEKK